MSDDSCLRGARARGSRQRGEERGAGEGWSWVALSGERWTWRWGVQAWRWGRGWGCRRTAGFLCGAEENTCWPAQPHQHPHPLHPTHLISVLAVSASGPVHTGSALPLPPPPSRAQALEASSVRCRVTAPGALGVPGPNEEVGMYSLDMANR